MKSVLAQGCNTLYKHECTCWTLQCSHKLSGLRIWRRFVKTAYSTTSLQTCPLISRKITVRRVAEQISTSVLNGLPSLVCYVHILNATCWYYGDINLIPGSVKRDTRVISAWYAGDPLGTSQDINLSTLLVTRVLAGVINHRACTESTFNVPCYLITWNLPASTSASFVENLRVVVAATDQQAPGCVAEEMISGKLIAVL